MPPVRTAFNPPSVVNHSTAYAVAMLLAAVEYWCACCCTLPQTSTLHPAPPAQVVHAVPPRLQALLSSPHPARPAPCRPRRRPAKGRHAVRSSTPTGIRAALMRVGVHCRQAGRSFTHLIAKSKVDGHVLVTSGCCPLCRQHAVPVTRAMMQCRAVQRDAAPVVLRLDVLEREHADLVGERSYYYRVVVLFCVARRSLTCGAQGNPVCCVLYAGMATFCNPS